MNSSAKSTAAISFLAAAALGAVVFMGCTVDSNTSGDVTGDDTSTEEQDSGTANDDAATPQDDAATGSTCATWSENFTAQACLDTHCCSEQAACAAIERSDNVPVTCDEYATCIAKVTKDAEEADAGDPDYSLCDDGVRRDRQVRDRQRVRRVT